MNLPHLAAAPMQSLYPLLFVLLWSSGFLGAKLGLPYIEPLHFLSIRYTLVLALMGSLVLATRAPWPKEPRQVLHIGVSGLLMHGVYLGGVFMAIRAGLPAGITALVVGLQPLLTALGAGAWLGERVGRWQWAGLALGFAGVALVVEGKFGQVPAAGLLPMLIPAVAALAGITAGTLYQKRYCPRFDLRTGALLQFAPSLTLTAPLAWHLETGTILWTGQLLFALAWLVLVLSLGAITLLNLLIRSGGAVNVASLFYLTPAVTSLMAWGLFGETLGPTALLGMGLAVGGVALARRGSS